MDATPANTSIITLCWQAGCTLRKWENIKNFEYECQNVYARNFRAGFANEIEQIRNQNKHKLETSVLCCILA